MPRILWLSPYSLHDLSSGASIHCKMLLEKLVERGFEVWSCSSFVFDLPQGAARFVNLQELLTKTDKNIFELDDKGIHYVYVRCKSTFEVDLTLNEQNMLYTVFGEVLERFKPDFVFGFGTGMCSMTAFAEAKRRGVYTIYPVLNGNHGNFSFPNVDFVLTDSHATEQMYKNRDHIHMIPTKEFFNPELYAVPKEERSPEYITLVNPAFEKGLSFFATIALKAKQMWPNQKFLVINSRGNFSENVKYLHTKNKPEEHPYQPELFTNVLMSKPVADMKAVYKVTKLLLVPSLWWESWGRVATEAVLNEIPVVASNSGGLSEATAGAGIHLPMPEHCLKDYQSIPTDEEIQPWINAINTMLNTDRSEYFAKAREQLSVDKTLDQIIEILRPYYERNPRNYIHYGFSRPRAPRV